MRTHQRRQSVLLGHKFAPQTRPTVRIRRRERLREVDRLRDAPRAAYDEKRQDQSQRAKRRMDAAEFGDAHASDGVEKRKAERERHGEEDRLLPPSAGIGTEKTHDRHLRARERSSLPSRLGRRCRSVRQRLY